MSPSCCYHLDQRAERTEGVGGLRGLRVLGGGGAGAERAESVGRTESVDFSAFLPLTAAIKLVLKSKKY